MFYNTILFYTCHFMNSNYNNMNNKHHLNNKSKHIQKFQNLVKKKQNKSYTCEMLGAFTILVEFVGQINEIDEILLV